jgi:HSP20 family protein
MSALTKWNPFKPENELELWSPPARWSQFLEMDRLQREMDRLFDAGRISLLPFQESITLAAWSPAVDITEDDHEYVVKAELPDVRKEDVKVTVEHDVLAIRGERKAEKEEKGKKYHRIERSYGSFERTFSLPQGTDAAKIRSEFKQGMLTVHLPKNPGAATKTIDIKVQ